MPSKPLPLLIIACLVFATAGVVAPVSAKDEASSPAAGRSAELDDISADIVAKFNSQAPASAFDPLLARIGKLGLTLNRGMSQDPDAVRAYGLQQFISEWQDYLVQKEKSPESANNSLQQLAMLSAQVPIVPRSTLLGMMVKPERVQENRQKKSNDELAALTIQVVAAIDAAKAPGDLDATIAAIGQFSNNRNDYNSNGNRTQNLKYFVQNWQDYLQAVQDGKLSDAHNDLHGLENANYDASFYPRSKILAALSALPAAPPVPTLHLDRPETITLDNLDEVLAQVVALRNNPAFQAMGENGLEQSFTSLKQAYAQIKEGRGREFLNNPALAYNGFGGLGRYTEAIEKLWLQVKLMAAPDAIEAPATASKPTSTDSMASYLGRQLNEAIAAKDWAFASRILKYEQLSPATSGDAYDDLIGIRALIIGGNHELAGQWDQAVAVYSSALNSTGAHLPIKEISGRLNAIQKAHPDDYAAGMKLPDPAIMRQAQLNDYRSRMSGGSNGLPNSQLPNR